MSNDIAYSGRIHILPHPESRLARLAMTNVPYVALYAIAVVLIAMTDHDPASAQSAWNYFIPLVGLVSAASGWSGYAGETWEARVRYVVRQVLHWGTLLLVIRWLFMSDVQHFLRAEDDGFVIIYLVGLTSLLAGIYLDWKMALFGLFLIFSGVVIAFLDDNAPLIAVGGTALMAVMITAFVWIKYHQQVDTKRAGGGRIAGH
ncbi:hypothetical protein [Thiocystis violacea]|uniref:hypothetical protein n=1 Tax=Thiocystis violacea TaxID=13725 RepID=UPI001908E534|nr:hypothetical protein [Thiocystis violacea]MBK1724020.1 hypothetical protein [Thiocystis violacea]